MLTPVLLSEKSEIYMGQDILRKIRHLLQIGSAQFLIIPGQAHSVIFQRKEVVNDVRRCLRRIQRTGYGEEASLPDAQCKQPDSQI